MTWKPVSVAVEPEELLMVMVNEQNGGIMPCEVVGPGALAVGRSTIRSVFATIAVVVMKAVRTMVADGSRYGVMTREPACVISIPTLSIR